MYRTKRPYNQSNAPNMYMKVCTNDVSIRSERIYTCPGLCIYVHAHLLHPLSYSLVWNLLTFFRRQSFCKKEKVRWCFNRSLTVSSMVWYNATLIPSLLSGWNRLDVLCMCSCRLGDVADCNWEKRAHCHVDAYTTMQKIVEVWPSTALP